HVHFGACKLADAELTLEVPHVQDVAAAVGLRVFDHEHTRRSANPASVSDLATAFGVEGRSLEDQAIARQLKHPRVRLCRGPRQKFCGRQVAKFTAALVATDDSSFACSSALGFKRLLELFTIERQAAFVEDLLGQ